MRTKHHGNTDCNRLRNGVGGNKVQVLASGRQGCQCERRTVLGIN